MTMIYSIYWEFETHCMHIVLTKILRQNGPSTEKSHEINECSSFLSDKIEIGGKETSIKMERLDFTRSFFFIF